MRPASPLLLGVAASLLLAAAPLSAASAPKVSVATIEQLPKPLPLPYDVAANANAQLAAAKALARKQNKRLLIELGGNWCADCRILAGVLDLPEVAAFVRKHYVVVSVDIGRLDKNMQIPQAYGVPDLDGVPALLVVDPRSNKLVNAGHLFALADARHMSPQALADWLAQWI